MLVFPNYAKNYASTIDKGLLLFGILWLSRRQKPSSLSRGLKEPPIGSASTRADRLIMTKLRTIVALHLATAAATAFPSSANWFWSLPCFVDLWHHFQNFFMIFIIQEQIQVLSKLIIRYTSLLPHACKTAAKNPTLVCFVFLAIIFN